MRAHALSSITIATTQTSATWLVLRAYLNFDAISPSNLHKLFYQTPAERVRARIKALLDKTSASKSEEEPENVECLYIPTPSQREMFEEESFEAAGFVSHRAPDKVHNSVIFTFIFIVIFAPHYGEAVYGNHLRLMLARLLP